MSFKTLVERASRLPQGHDKFEGYYEGTRRLDALGITLPPRARILEILAPFPKIAVDVLSEVLTPEGFILGTDRETPELLRRWWQANDLDTGARLAIVEALVQGQSYLIVGPGERPGTPRITAHSRRGFAVSYDAFGRVHEAVRRFKLGETEWAAYYVPGVTYYLQLSRGGTWSEMEQLRAYTGLSRPPVVPVTNRERLKDVEGRSEILHTITQTDAASRTSTNLQVGQELLAMPTKYIFSDDVEAAGSLEEGLAAYFGRYITGPAGSTAGSIPGADLSPILNSFRLYALNISAITGIPPSMLGIATDNPTSAEAMRVAKDRLISRAEVKAAMFGDAFEDAARLALEMEGMLPEHPETLEMQWRDAAYSSASAKSALMLQAHAQGVISAQTARDGLQLTPEQRAREDATSAVQTVARSQMGG